VPGGPKLNDKPPISSKIRSSAPKGKHGHKIPEGLLKISNSTSSSPSEIVAHVQQHKDEEWIFMGLKLDDKEFGNFGH
jgi:hypothetical protein